MSFCKRVALGVGLAAGLWCVLHGLFPAVPPAGGIAVAQPPQGNPWDAIEWVERRYKIEAIRFKCRDETGVDWPEGDEVMIGTIDAKGSTVSNEIDNIDSGDVHTFDPSKSGLVSIRPGIVVLGETSFSDDRGEPAPLWFEVEFWEKDAVGVSLPGFCAVLGPEPGGHVADHCPNDGWGDDFIGHRRLEFAVWELEAALPNVGDEFIETAVLSPCEPGYICTSGWGPWDQGDYTFTYRITRLRDVRVDLRSVLDDAMRRSGTRSEVEAIAAGLRSLRAPRPRMIEPEPEE